MKITENPKFSLVQKENEIELVVPLGETVFVPGIINQLGKYRPTERIVENGKIVYKFVKVDTDG
jgi:hypothetical protein